MFVLGLPASVVEMQLGDSFGTKQFNGLHNEARVSRGVGSHKRANEEERVVSMRHSLLLHIMVAQIWRLADIILIAPRAVQCILFPWGAVVEQSP